MSAVITDFKKQLITLAVFLFPILCASLQHAGSTIFGILLIFGLRYGWQGWAQLEKDEKQFFIGLIVLFSVIATGLFYTADVAEGASKLERYLRILLVIPVYLMLRRFDLQLGKIFLSGVIVAIPVLAIQGWYQTEVLGGSVASGAYHRILYGDMVILFCSLVAVATINFARKPVHYVIASLLIVAAIYAVIIAGSRAAWLFIPIVLVMMMFLYRKEITTRGWMIISAIIVVLVVTVQVIQPDRIVTGIKQGVSELELYSKDPKTYSSFGARLNFWRNSLIMFSEDPVFGKGTGSYQAENKILIEKGISYVEYVADYGNAHSIYFNTLAENGLVGVIAMLMGLIILPFRYFYRRWQIAKSPEQYFYTLAGMISVIAFAWFGASETWVARNPFVNVYFMCMLVFMHSTSSVFSAQNIEQNKA